MNMDIQYYAKKEHQGMYKWEPGMDMLSVSMSASDADNGSPKKGDMIAVNSKDDSDRWLISAKFFGDNYVL